MNFYFHDQGLFCIKLYDGSYEKLIKKMQIRPTLCFYWNSTKFVSCVFMFCVCFLKNFFVSHLNIYSEYLWFQVFRKIFFTHLFYHQFISLHFINWKNYVHISLNHEYFFKIYSKIENVIPQNLSL